MLLTIAGFDGCGGAGVTADTQVFRDYGEHGLAVVTAIVPQNTQGVRAVYPQDAAVVADQLDAIFDDFSVRAVKVGMLGSAAVVGVVAAALASAGDGLPVVLDPVGHSGDGRVELSNRDTLDAIVEELLPRVDVFTPNLDEARFWGGDSEEPAALAVQLLGFGPGAVLLKVGHEAPHGSEDGEASATISDIFADAGGALRLSPKPRIVDANVHGTGCQLSSAIAAELATGHGARVACERARDYMADLFEHRRVQAGRGSKELFLRRGCA